MMAKDKGIVNKIVGQLYCICVCVCVCLYSSLAYHFSCVEQHEAAMADLKTKLKNTDGKLQSANKCENFTALELFFTM